MNIPPGASSYQTPRSEFAGRFDDLPEPEQREALRATSSGLDLAGADNTEAPVQAFSPLPAAIDSASVALLRHQADAMPQATQLYLVRSSAISAAQALSRNAIFFSHPYRQSQINMLKEFRGDTREAATGEVNRWLDEQLPRRSTAQQNGAIGAGVAIRMTQEEAQQLAIDVPNLSIMRNRALALIHPSCSGQKTATLRHRAAWHLDAIGMSGARRDGKAYSGRNVQVAVMDTGMQVDHPELTGKVTGLWKIRTNPATADFHALEIDNAHVDTDGHGTHVAGLICGNNVGVAPDARLTSILMMPNRLATTFDFVRCLDWAAEHPEINLINFSAGISPFTDELMPFIADLISTGALPIMAVGNDGPNNTKSPGNYIDGASVGAVDHPGTKVSSFSGSGQQMWNQALYTVPDFVAPGNDIWSSFPGSLFMSMSGTSMAAPVVTGIAACLIEQASGLLSPLDLMDLLKRSCNKIFGEPDSRQGAGLVRVPLRP